MRILLSNTIFAYIILLFYAQDVKCPAPAPPPPPATCSIYPKIFGGSGGDTWSYQMDIYNDMLARAG